jgi:hypothetical protein
VRAIGHGAPRKRGEAGAPVHGRVVPLRGRFASRGIPSTACASCRAGPGRRALV